MTEFLRVKQNDTGHELTVSRTVFDAAPKDGYTVLGDKPATDAGSNPLPPKFKTSVDKSAAAKSGQKAESTKENS